MDKDPNKARIRAATWAKANKDRIRARCKAARTANPEKYKAASKAYYQANREKILARTKIYNKENNRKQIKRHEKKYQEPFENKQKRLEEQGFRCANPGCRSTEPGLNGWHTDHNHNTGKIRGELCYKCNLALGLLQDDKFKAEGLAEYLRKNGE